MKSIRENIDNINDGYLPAPPPPPIPIGLMVVGNEQSFVKDNANSATGSVIQNVVKPDARPSDMVCGNARITMNLYK